MATRGAGDSIKPGVERSGTPGTVVEKITKAREAADSGCDYKNVLIPLSAATRASDMFRCRLPGVPLRFPPRFMLLHPPRVGTALG
jgi:hypothetical protein